MFLSPHKHTFTLVILVVVQIYISDITRLFSGLILIFTVSVLVLNL